MATALNLFVACSQTAANFCLQMLKLVLKASVADPGQIAIIESMPTDIRAARRIFPLDLNVTLFAACPACHTLYPPTHRNEIDIYPARCSSLRFPDTHPCQTRLCKLGVKKGYSVRVPIRPFAMQSFTGFLGAFYSRPGIEAAIRSTNRRIRTGEPIRDINQSQGLQEFRDSAGNFFLQSKDEIRTIWSLSYDAFNPFHNKAAGKSASAGVLVMLCLSLPPELRCKPENIYLVGVIPGPKQPPGDALNPYLTPLIDTLNTCYHEGTWFTRTYEYPAGRRSREAIIPCINDLPGARKISGCASHSARRFCSLCHLLKADINDTNYTTHAWRSVTLDEYRRSAEAWRDAPNKSRRAKLYKENGIRWSELLRLTYWDPTRYVVIDGMHNLFLGLVKHHFRVIVGMDWEEPNGDDPDFQSDAPAEKDMRRGREVFIRSPTMSSLRKLTIPVLRRLCEEQQVVHEVHRPNPKKRDYISVLLVCRVIYLIASPLPNLQPGICDPPTNDPYSTKCLCYSRRSRAD